MSKKKTSTREEVLIDGLAQGKAPAQAARDAGFSYSFSRVNVYQKLAQSDFRERVKRRKLELICERLARPYRSPQADEIARIRAMFGEVLQEIGAK